MKKKFWMDLINSQTPKVFRQMKTPEGVDTTLLDFAFPSKFFENMYDEYVIGVKESNDDNEEILSSLRVLENQGQTPFCMSYHISGCKHDTKLVLVSILTFSRSGISKLSETIAWPWRLVLELKVTYIHYMTFLSSGCSSWCRLDHGVNSQHLQCRESRKTQNQSPDFDNQGQTPFYMTFHISGCKHLGVNSNIFVVEVMENVGNTCPWRLTLELMVIHIFIWPGLSLGVCLLLTWCWCLF